MEGAGRKKSRSQIEHLPPAGNLQEINMKEYDSDGKTTAGISVQTFGKYDRPRGRSGKGGQKRHVIDGEI